MYRFSALSAIGFARRSQVSSGGSLGTTIHSGFFPRTQFGKRAYSGGSSWDDRTYTVPLVLVGGFGLGLSGCLMYTDLQDPVENDGVNSGGSDSTWPLILTAGSAVIWIILNL